ncbi:MAG: Holliday junction branch migration protein RuvA, partial [Alistipes finegoldii]|nr:Holliday junction branch migration protein RuvA [Alistipes finegoldii]
LPAAGNGKKLEEALAALVMLGFAKTAAEKALRGILRENPGASVEDLVRMGLKSL